MLELTKTRAATSIWEPLEQGQVRVDPPVVRVVVEDAARRVYVDAAPRRGKLTFTARGVAGEHRVTALDGDGNVVDEGTFRLQPETRISCDQGPYAKLAEHLMHEMTREVERRVWQINGRLYHMLVGWGRDHVHTLKAMKYAITDVKSGLEYWLEGQEPNGMFWDCIYDNPEAPAPTWLGEALGEGWFYYDEGMKYIVRRIPVEADCEFLYTEGVWYIWKASGDDEWMKAQLPRLEKALVYNNSHPDRWSKKHQLVRRSMCMDSWDFVNPHYCSGDHRCINPGDPQFLFHGDNSGLYSSYWRMAEMYEHLGDTQRAAELRAEGEELRERANKKLFFEQFNTYGHMLPELLPEKDVYALVGDERQRMSLSLGYTINRRLPTHEMALRIIREYQRRYKAKKRESFAEWWTMDPPYVGNQWPGEHGSSACPEGEYMNGAICTIIAGEIAKAAYDHGEEAYATDILDRVWQLAERDNGHIHQAYRRLPDTPPPPKHDMRFVDLRSVVNRGLRNGASRDVPAWTSEGENDMRNLPTGRQTFGVITFDVINPKANGGRSILRLDHDPDHGAQSVTIPVDNLTGKSLFFLHTLGHSASRNAVVGTYDVHYADGTVERIFVREGHEIGLWWGINDRSVNRSTTRVAWQGANGTWKNVGLHMFGWNNPHPDKPITAIRAEAMKVGGRGGGIMLGGISVSDNAVAFETPIRSYGLPDCWAQAAVYYAVAEGLAGVEDAGRAFSKLRLSPRWASTEARRADVTLAYPASHGYCSYSYTLDEPRRRVTLDVAGSFDTASVHCLLPGKAKAKRVTVGDEPVDFRNVRIESSSYVDFDLPAPPAEPIVIEF